MLGGRCSLPIIQVIIQVFPSTSTEGNLHKRSSLVVRFKIILNLKKLENRYISINQYPNNKNSDFNVINCKTKGQNLS